MINIGLPKVAIIVLNWNGWEDTIECLESLTQIDYPNYQVIVVDNGSNDDSVLKIKQWAEGKLCVISRYLQHGKKNMIFNYFEYDVDDNISKLPVIDEKIIILKCKNNLGYAKGNNVGARFAFDHTKADYALILNNDTVVMRNFLGEMIDEANIDAKSMLFGPKILNYERKDYLRSAVYKRPGFFAMLMFFSPLKHLFLKFPLFYAKQPKNNDPRKVYAISGSCMLFRKMAMQDIGGFDEATFLGWEEFVIAEKMKLKGYSTVFVPRSVIYHKWGRSTAKIDPADKMIGFLESEKYFQRNYLHLPSIQYGIVNVIQLSIFAFYSMFNADYRKSLIKIFFAMFGD